MSKSLLREVQDRVDKRTQEFKKEFAEKLQESGIEMELNEPYTYDNAPDWVKKLPKEARDTWIKAYNAAHKEYGGDEAKSAATASATIRKMGYSKKGEAWVKEAEAYYDVYSKTLLLELQTDVDLILQKAKEGLKGRVGSPAVRHFLREVEEKVKNMIAKIQDKETKTIAESIVDKIEEAIKNGSFSDIEDKVRAAIKLSTWFPEKIGDQFANGPYIRDMYPDRCVVSYEGRLYEVSYGLVNDVVVLGQPKEVEEIYVSVQEAQWDAAFINDLPDSSFAYIESGGTKDKDGKTVPRSLRHLPYKDKGGKVDLAHLRNALARAPQTNISADAKKSALVKLHAAAKTKGVGDVKETGFEAVILKEAQVQDFVISDFVSLKEAKFNSDFSEVEVVLIECGVNPGKKRYYPDKTIREAAPMFKGWKNYIDHPTPTQERERPERSLKDWASTITESHYENGMAMAKVSVHDQSLRERLADPVAREHIGLSILAGGKISVGRVNGEDGYEIVEAIIPKRKNGPPSVDWVTEAGARGRVSRLLESQRKGVKMELESATVQDLKETRKDLVEAITKETQAGNSDKVVKLEKDLKEDNDKIAAFDKSQKIAKQVELAESIIAEKKIPDAVKGRVISQVKTSVIEGDEKTVKESIGKIIEGELDYVNKITGKGKIKTGTAGATDIKESLQADLDKRAGMEVKETDKK